MKELKWMSFNNNKSDDGDENNDSNDQDQVLATNNKIYFYSEVTRPKVLELNKNLFNIGVSMQNRANILGMTDPGCVYLHINSYGGSVFAGMAATDYILSSPVPVVTVIDGCAASAATLMSVVGSHRMMHKHSFMLIHQLSSWTGGKYAELQDDMKNNDLLMKTIKEIYQEHTKIPKSEIAKILKRDLWWNAEQCLKYGLIDEIV